MWTRYQAALTYNTIAHADRLMLQGLACDLSATGAREAGFEECLDIGRFPYVVILRPGSYRRTHSEAVGGQVASALTSEFSMECTDCTTVNFIRLYVAGESFHTCRVDESSGADEVTL